MLQFFTSQHSTLPPLVFHSNTNSATLFLLILIVSCKSLPLSSLPPYNADIFTVCIIQDSPYILHICFGELPRSSLWGSEARFENLVRIKIEAARILTLLKAKYLHLFFPSNLCKERENQQDATIRSLLSTSVSTCFGHHYAHLQEIKDRVLLHTVYCSGSAGCGW